MGNYKNIQIQHIPVHVEEAEIDRILLNIQHNNSLQITVDDRAAKTGDLVWLNFTTKEKTKKKEAHNRRVFPIVLGTHKLPRQTEEAIIGSSTGDRLKLTISFPQDFPSLSLAGRQTDCTVLIHKICRTEVQPIDDDFALDFSEYGTLQEWKDALLQELFTDRAEDAALQEQEALLDRIIADSDIPADASLAQAVADEMYEDLLYDIRASHLELEDYLKHTGRTVESLRREQYEEAVLLIRRQAVLHAVAEAEQITASREELDERLCEIACEEGLLDRADGNLSGSAAWPDFFDEEEIEAIEDELVMDKSMEFLMHAAVWRNA